RSIEVKLAFSFQQTRGDAETRRQKFLILPFLPISPSPHLPFLPSPRLRVPESPRLSLSLISRSFSSN
ncbi:MAG: hypothetical protein SWY16_26925, partial [Cyanobacteriota bacterium]|nr:hypothetical protein [Cyanobacteriota bacterium]